MVGNVALAHRYAIKETLSLKGEHMMRISVLTSISIAALGVAACGSSDDTNVKGADYTQSYDVGDGTATVSTGGDITVDLPLGFKVYPGAKVVSTMKINNPAVQGNTVFMETSDGIQDVADFYRAQAGKQGIDINMETASADTILLAGRNEGEAGFNLVASLGDEGRTTVQLTVSEMASQE